MENIITNPGFYGIQEQIFGSFDYETLLVCLQVSKDWNVSLKRMACVKFLEEFGKKIAKKPGEWKDEESPVEIICPGWRKTVQKHGLQASIKDLQDIKKSFAGLLYFYYLNAQDDDDEDYEDIEELSVDDIDDDYEYAIHIPGLKYGDRLRWSESHPNLSCAQIRATLRKYGSFGSYFIWSVVDSNNPELLKFVADSGYDLEHLNKSDTFEPKVSAFQYACTTGNTESVRFMIEHSKEYNINLNYSNLMGHTPFLRACDGGGNYETVKLFFDYFHLFMKNYNEHGIDINAQDQHGRTALEYAAESIQHYHDLEDSDCYNESFDEAINDVKECMKMFRKEIMSIDFKEKGNKAFRQRKYEEAIEEYTFALQVNDTNPVFYTNRAQAFLRLGKAMFAAQDCRHALKLKPDFVKAFIHLAKALKELGAFQEAIATLERAEEFSNDEQASVVKTYKLEILEEQTKNISLAKDQQASK